MAFALCSFGIINKKYEISLDKNHNINEILFLLIVVANVHTTCARFESLKVNIHIPLPSVLLRLIFSI